MGLDHRRGPVGTGGYHLGAAFWRGEWPALTAIALAALASLLLLPHLGSNPVPVHWGISGQPDRWAPPVSAVLQNLALLAGVYLLMVLLPLIDPRRAAYGRFLPTLRAVRLAAVLLLAGLLGLSLAAGLGVALNAAVTVRLLISLLIAFLGNLMPRLRQNWWFGIRTPWTLASEAVWRHTHRVGGGLMVAAGLGSLPFAIWGAPGIWLTLVLIVGGALPVVYSYLDWRREAGA